MRNRRAKGLSFRKQRKSLNIKGFIPALIWIGEILGVILLAFLLVFFFGFRTKMVGEAMSGTLEDADTVLVNRFSYAVSSPAQGDIIAFLPNGNKKSHYYIRRVVATPGDTVQISDGELYVNGEIYELPGFSGQITVSGMAEEELTLGDDEYFVMGDNANSSEDSRHSNVGLVSTEDICGKVWFVLLPKGHFGFVS